jgi:5,10-methylene-tetrahydrofolate dehydrogenase/methenyl tetrahydrofolate cyclohydrolase
MTAVVMDGNALRDEIVSGIRTTVEAAGSPAICLATVLVGDDGPSQRYVRSKHAKAAEAGLTSRHVDLPVTATRPRSSPSCEASSSTATSTASSCSCRFPSVSTPNP